MHTQDLKYPLLRTRFPKIRYLGEHVKKCYCVDGRVGNNLGKREYFAKLTEARIRADQIEVEVANRGAEALAFSTENRVMAVSCAERLRPHGKTLLDATTHYVNWLDAEARHQQSPPISYVVEQYLEQRERDWRRGDLAELSFYEIRHRARRLSADLGTLRINELDAPRVRTYVESFPVSARTRLNLRLRLSKVCSFAVERGWL